MTQLLEGPEKKPGKWQVMCGHIACYGTKGPIADSDRAAAILWNLRPTHAALRAALREIIVINEESAGDCRKRMGTRRGNSIVAARAALKTASPNGTN
jgi:hypothetical protein